MKKMKAVIKMNKLGLDLHELEKRMWLIRLGLFETCYIIDGGIKTVDDDFYIAKDLLFSKRDRSSWVRRMGLYEARYLRFICE